MNKFYASWRGLLVLVTILASGASMKAQCTFTISAAPSNTICTGTTVTLSTDATLSYSWSNGSTASTMTLAPTSNTMITLNAQKSSTCTAATVSINIYVLTGPPTFTIANTSTATSNGVCPGKTVNIAATATSPGTNSISWLGGITNGVTFTPATSGSYTLNVTNVCGVSSSVISVSIHPVPVPTIAVSATSLCSGVSLITTATGGTFASWSHGFANGASFFPSITAAYTTTITSALGCTATGVSPQVTVVTTPTVPPTASPSNFSVCAGFCSTVTATGAQNYTWVPINIQGTNVVVVCPTVTTTYTLTRSNSNCVDIQTFTINVNQLPAVLASASTPTSCSGKTVSLTSIGGNYTYTWLPTVPTLTTQNIVVQPTISTTYTLIVKDANCYNSATVAVQVFTNPIIAIATTATAVCSTHSVQLTASGGDTYTWNAIPGPTPSPINATVVVMNPTVTTSYTVTGDNAATCTASAVRVIIAQINPTVSITRNPNLFRCAGDNSTLTASGAHTYTWSHNPIYTASTIVTPSTSTIFTVTGTYTNTPQRCTGVGTINVPVFLPTLSVSGPTSSCKGGTITLTALGGDTYTWNGTYKFAQLTVSPPGPTVYLLAGHTQTTGGVSCISSRTLFIDIYPNPTVTATTDRTVMCKGEFVNLTGHGANTYSWTHGMPGSPVAVSPTAITNYVVIGTDLNFCKSTGTVTVRVQSCVGLNEFNMDNAVAVYPNPNNGEFVISAQQTMALSVTNELGQLVTVLTLNEGNNHQVTMKDLAPGIYFISGDTPDGPVRQKVIVQK